MSCFRPFAVMMLALMVCSLVQAQDEAAPGRGGRGGQQGRGGAQQDPAAAAQTVRFILLRVEEVQAALDLDQEAVETLNAALADAMPARRGGRRGATETADDSEAKVKREAAIETIHKTLGEETHARLDGIVAQVLQGRALQDKIIAEKLEITEEQAAEIKKVFDDSRTEMRSAMQDAGGDREAMMKIAQDVMKDANTAVSAILTDDQTKALEELKGEAVELPENVTRRMMGGGRGGMRGRRGGGGGRPGAGGGDGGNDGGGN